MARLTDTQLIVLSKAAQRDDGAAVLPKKITEAAATKVAASLVARKLMREIRSKSGMPVWRTNDDDRQLSLVILKAGRDAIDVEEDASDVVALAPIASVPSKPKGAQSRKNGEQPSGFAQPEEAIAAAPRLGSKQALVIEMLSAKDGATIEALIAATGWLAHTTRAALTGLRKRGFTIELIREKGQASIYRIAPCPPRSSANELIAA